MGCGCQNHSKGQQAQNPPAFEAVERTRPLDQCIACTQKHICDAWAAYNEYTYENANRAHIMGQLQLAVHHSFRRWREIADMARDISHLVQQGNDFAICGRWDTLLEAVALAYQEEHPDMAARLEQLRTVPNVIIPLGRGGTGDNTELRYLLRSIDAHLKNYGRVFLATDCAPDWLSDAVTIVEAGDIYSDNKDANLHRKILRVLDKYEVGDFVFCADDNCFMQDIAAGAIPTLVNGKPRPNFEGENLSKWQKRVKHTLEWADSQGAHLEHHYEVHCPQLFHGAALREKLAKVDYVAQPGLTIYTCWRVLTDTWRDALPQAQYKTTMENECGETLAAMTDAQLCARPFLGYNDGGVKCGMLNRLARLFPEKARFER